MSSKQSISLIINTGSAINRDMYYMSCSFTDRTFDEPYSRLFFYQDKNKDKWFYHDLPDLHVVSTCFPPPTSGATRKIYALSEEGYVECFSRDAISVEKIQDAGLDPSSKMYGYVNKIKHIDGQLYSCGHRGQIYRRNESTWEHFDDGILQKNKLIIANTDMSFMESVKLSIDETLDLFDIDGSTGDIYVVGTDGFLANHDGVQWHKLPRLTAADLHCIYISSSGIVWIVGSQGSIINGSARLGFKVLARKKIDADFYSATEFQNNIYIGANNGIYKVIDNTIKKVDITAKEVSSIESKDGVMWALSSEKLLRFDGVRWDEFVHIDN